MLGRSSRLTSGPASVVAFARNVRSFATFRDVLGGGAFPPGAPLGLAEYQARIAASGYFIKQTDRLRVAEATGKRSGDRGGVMSSLRVWEYAAAVL